MRGSQNNRADVNRRAGEHELVRVVRMQQPLTQGHGSEHKISADRDRNCRAHGETNRLLPVASIRCCAVQCSLFIRWLFSGYESDASPLVLYGFLKPVDGCL